MEHPDGGVEVVALADGDPLALFRELALVTSSSGFVPALASAEAPDVLPESLCHRHVAIVCEEDAARPVAIHWVRLLAQSSPRRHIVITFGDEHAPKPTPGGGFGVPRHASAERSLRLARAERWRRRGRMGMAERWMVAAAESARRHGDPASAALVEVQLLEALLQVDRTDEAGRRAADLLRRGPDWPTYASAGALFADVLIAREEFGRARSWVSSLTAEATLRGLAAPTAAVGRLAELDFWQGRGSDPLVMSAAHADPDVYGWRAARAWGGHDMAQLAALAIRLGRAGDDSLAHRYWHALVRVLLIRGSRAADLSPRVDDLMRLVRGHDALARRRQRLAAVVSAGALLAREDTADARALLSAARGPGPEGTASRRLAARLQDADDRDPASWTRMRRAVVPGIELLASGRRDMHLVDGLSGLMSLIEEAEDELGILVGGCRWICRQAGALRAAIVSADHATLVAAEGWRRADLTGEIAEILRGPSRDIRLPDHDAATGGFGVSVRYGGVTTGHVVVFGRASDRPALQQASQAVAAVCGSALRARLDTLTAGQRARHSIPEIVGDSPLMEAVREAVVRAASAPFPVLIEGESGTGKELVARALHRLGPRRDHRLSAVNCAALTDELVEAELFGHARGAFTGAVGPRAGLFEEAHGGTLFLDEVTELSPRAQAKLLRTLQEREIRRVGENQPRPIDVRIVAACNVPLTEAVGSGRFRDDLRFRLAVIRIRLPSLRERLEDVPSLAQVFWRRAAAEAGTRALLGPDAIARLTRHPWPGNVRELQNVVAGLVVASPFRGRVGARHVEQVLSHVAVAGEMPGVRLEIARRTFERRVITAALVRHAGRRSAAAIELGLSRQGLTKALRRLGLAPEEDAAGVA